MLRKYHFLIFLSVAIYFSFSRSTDAEYENSKYLYSPNENEVEDCEKNNSKCEHFSTYPRLFIEDLIKKNLIKKEWFSEDEGDLIHLNVLNDNESDSKLCQENKTRVYPRGMRTKNGEFIYIVQAQVNNDRYYQVIIPRVCYNINTNGLCSVRDNDRGGDQFLTYHNQNKFNFTCEQEKGLKSMVGVTLTGKVVRNADMTYNCCCVCKYRDFTNSSSVERSKP